jgi:hypothetical protein
LALGSSCIAASVEFRGRNCFRSNVIIEGRGFRLAPLALLETVYLSAGLETVENGNGYVGINGPWFLSSDHVNVLTFLLSGQAAVQV